MLRVFTLRGGQRGFGGSCVALTQVGAVARSLPRKINDLDGVIFTKSMDASEEGGGAGDHMAVAVAIWAFQKKPSFEVRGTEILFNKCVRSNMLLTALNCSICKLQDKALHGWTERTDYTGKFLVEFSDKLPTEWTRNQGWFLFNNAKIDSKKLHLEIFEFQPDYLMVL